MYCPVLLVSAIWAASAQQAVTSLKFEVASVKASSPAAIDPPIQAMRTSPDPGRFTRKDIATQAQQMMMLQNLLAQRFGLKVHREKREMPVYELVVAKGRPKFNQAVAVPPAAAPKMAFDADGVPVLPPGGGTAWGLPGKDGTSSWGVMHDEITSAGAAVFAALQSQLGLKLESKKGMVEVLVVDHCERMPTEN
ncbi:MAG TPA: TIGR03435 family protein [Bryobacteraceae bacterium]|nr:TIGR03435 family protein [Bryobacteraceae bacterium]